MAGRGVPPWRRHESTYGGSQWAIVRGAHLEPSLPEAARQGDHRRIRSPERRHRRCPLTHGGPSVPIQIRTPWRRRWNHRAECPPSWCPPCTAAAATCRAWRVSDIKIMGFNPTLGCYCTVYRRAWSPVFIPFSYSSMHTSNSKAQWRVPKSRVSKTAAGSLRQKEFAPQNPGIKSRPPWSARVTDRAWSVDRVRRESLEAKSQEARAGAVLARVSCLRGRVE